MTKRWLTVAAATALAVCASVGLRAVGESTLSVELPPSMSFENPFATQATPTPPTPTPPVAEVAEVPEVVSEVLEVVAEPVEVASEPVAPELESAEEMAAPVEVPPQLELASSEAWPNEATALPSQDAGVPVEVAVEEAVEEVPPAQAPELPTQWPVMPPMESTAATPSNEDPSSDEAPSEPWMPSPEPENEMLEALESVWPEVETTPIAPEFDAASTTPYTPTVAELSQQLLPTVRRAYGLAQRGALFAAQSEFVRVLHRIAQAKDAEQATDEHARALAAGLRALDEADDFMPEGVQLEAEMNVGVIASSHRTPPPEAGPPATAREAVAHYHDFAQQQLARCAADERAGSMALYGLGKVYNRLANESDSNLRHERKAMSMFLAALRAEPENHLAANEVGVMLARSGRPEQAATMFRRAIDIAPTATNYHNLATVERKLGQLEQANANQQYSLQLATRDRAAGAMSLSKGVRWVAPQEMAQTAGAPQPVSPPMNATPIAPMAAAPGDAKTPAARQALPRGPRGGGEVSTAAGWPQKLIPSGMRR